MRKLKTKDIPVFCRCLKKVGAKEKIKAIAQQADTAADVWALGFEAIWDLFDTVTESTGEAAVYEALSGPFEMAPEDVADMDLPDLIAALKQLAEENNLLDFFKSAASLMR